MLIIKVIPMMEVVMTSFEVCVLERVSWKKTRIIYYVFSSMSG